MCHPLLKWQSGQAREHAQHLLRQQSKVKQLFFPQRNALFRLHPPCRSIDLSHDAQCLFLRHLRLYEHQEHRVPGDRQQNYDDCKIR